MAIDPLWLDKLLRMKDLASRDTLVVNGVELPLPLVNPRALKQRPRDWQRRVLADVIPDSVTADAPERTPFRILHALTTNQRTHRSIDDALDGELAVLEPLFRAETETKRKKMTLAFHVLAVRAASKGESDTKGFTERTFLLLCRNPQDGSLNEALVRRVIEELRRHPATLDLAQRTLLERIQPGWTPSDEPHFDRGDAVARVMPFDASAARLFQEDLESILTARLPPADFFHVLNSLLTIHFGLYQPRVAALLNPQMELLFRELEAPSPDNLEDLRRWVERAEQRHPFTASLSFRAPDAGSMRPVALDTPARLSFEMVAANLARFHFNILMLAQLRRLGEAYHAHRWGLKDPYLAGKLDADTDAALQEKVRTPLDFLNAMQDEPDFAEYLERAGAALAVRFLGHQIPDALRERALGALREAPSSLHGLTRLYEIFNLGTGRDAAHSRAHKQGIQVTSRLLRLGQDGLAQSRGRVGTYFEIGARLLPLLLLLVVGPGREKIPVDTLWERLGRYGIALDEEERTQLLERFRTMGLYERYSDAGEAEYVRNLILSRATS